jgi:aminopeptidase N
MRSEQPRSVRLSDYHPPRWRIETVKLDIALDATRTRVLATLTVAPNETPASAAPLVLDGDELTLASIRLDGVELATERYEVSPDRLVIAEPPPRPFVLDLETVIDPSANTQLMGLYRAGDTYCTQCEAEGFRRITYFLDRPDVMSVYTTRIEAEKAEAPVLLANGNLIEGGDIAGTTRHFAVWHDPFPKPAYLFAMVGGNLGGVEDTFITASGRSVKLMVFVEPGKEARATYAMEALKRSMRWDEEAFGREYDLDIFMIVAVSAFNMGAMENKGLNIFNDKYVLASPDTATDADFARIEAVIAHEYFHNWTGDRITCRDWFQLCLKEGLTVFRDQEFTSDQRSRPVKRITDVRVLRAQQFVEDSGPLAHPVRPEVYREINNFYTATVYEKGAELVRMIKTLVGATAFRAGMDLYFARHDGQAVTIEDFVLCFAETGDLDFDQFMRWYRQAGTPEVTVTIHHDAAARTCSLEIAQTQPPTPGQPVKEPLVIPLAIGLLDAEGRDLPLVFADDGRPLERGVLVLTKPAETFVFGGIETRTVLSLNRGFSAPVKVAANLSQADLRLLAARDSDPFNRWQAVQTLASSLLTANVCAARTGKPPQRDRGLVAALEAVLRDTTLEPDFAAQMLALPSEADIARDIGRDVDPDAIFAARRRLRGELARDLGPALRDAYRRMETPGPYRPDAEDAGRRAFKNACLDLLAADATPAAIALAARQYQNADNMTDRMAALSTLALHPVPERQAALDDFYRHHERDPLVIDKWFALQATIPEASCLARVRELAHHPAFSLTNPNRVRALIGSFAQANQTQFNRLDGEGYRFVADAVLDLDARNPQVAARMMTAFRSWRALEPQRRERAEAELRRVGATTPLSNDLRDIVERSLAP